MANTQMNDLNNQLKESEKSMRLLNKLGDSFRKQMAQAAQVLSKRLSLESGMKKLVSQTERAVSELKEIDELMTRISRTSGSLSPSELEALAEDSYEAAGKYGKTITQYLEEVEKASRAGYKNAAGIARLSAAAQAAGGMTAQLAEDCIAAADEAFRLGGSVERLGEVLDGSHSIAARNKIDMAELARGMSAAGSRAASFGVDADEAAAALGTLIASTKRSGAEMAGAFQAILSYLGQVADEAEGIDAEGLQKYEAACRALNVSLRETRNGAASLRAPMEVLRDLAQEYAKLDLDDTKRADLLSSVGAGATADALDALLKNYDMYSKMLADYAQGGGSMAAEAQKAASSWEGSLNRLSNTWTEMVGNIVEPDGVADAINGLNSLLEVVNDVTDKLGPLGSVGLGTGLFAGVKNIGKTYEYTVFRHCYLF